MELAALQSWPIPHTTDYDEFVVTVTRGGGFMLRRVFYIVPARLIDHPLRARVPDDWLEYMLGSKLVIALAPARPY